MKKMTNSIVTLMIFIFAVLISSCGGGGGQPDSEIKETPSLGEALPVEALPIDEQIRSEQTPLEPVAAAAGGFPAFDEVKIFPGAEGFGVKSVGGRGGILCFLTSLADSGPGTLRDCAERAEPRIVVFKTGGTIEVDSTIEIKNPFISIYGQTAPGDGILLRASLASANAPLAIMTHDVLVQHMRIRAGTSHQVTCCRDAIQIGSHTPGNAYNIVLDHNSISWGTDEILDIFGDTHDLTLSYNIVSESLYDNGSNGSGPAGRGIIIGANGAHSISVHHNYIAHSFQRNPLVIASGIIDITNNLIYHWLSRGGENDTRFPGQQVNWIKNRFLALEHLAPEFNSQVLWGDILLTKRAELPTEVYFEGNLGHHRPSNDLPEWKIAHTSWNEPYDPALGWHSSSRYPAPPVTEIDASELPAVLPAIVGATAPKRDAVDERLFSQYLANDGLLPNCVGPDDRPGDIRCQVNAGGWPVMNPGTAPTDSDNDGIPDAWEQRYGLDPQQADSLADNNSDGVLNVEDWAYSLSVEAE